MLQYDIGNWPGELDVFQYVVACPGVGFYYGEFHLVQLPRLAEDFNGNEYFTEVMQKAGHAARLDLLVRKPQLLGYSAGELSRPLLVAGGVAISCFYHHGYCLDSAFEHFLHTSVALL